MSQLVKTWVLNQFLLVTEDRNNCIHRYFQFYITEPLSVAGMASGYTVFEGPLTLVSVYFFFFKNMEGFTNLRVILAQGPCPSSLCHSNSSAKYI